MFMAEEQRKQILEVLLELGSGIGVPAFRGFQCFRTLSQTMAVKMVF